MSKQKSRIFPHYTLILFWTLFPGVAAGIIVTIILLVIAAITSDWDLRLIGIPILAAAFLLSLVGLIANSVFVLVRLMMSKRNGSVGHKEFMYNFLYLDLFCLLFVVLLLSSCAGNVPGAITKSKTEITTTATSPPPVAKPFPTEILSPNDSLELVSITPASGTMLRKGTRVQFKVTIDYKLNSIKSAFVRADLGIENGKAIGIAQFPPVRPGQGDIEILQGSGTVVVEDTVDIDFLTEKVSNDKVYLILSLYYFKSETRMLIVYRVLKDYYFNLETSSR